MDLSTTKVLLISLHLKTKHDVYTMAFLHTICLTHWICCRCTPGTIPLFRGISSLGGLDKLRASESCESTCEPCEPCETDSQSIFLSSAFGGFWQFGTSFRYSHSPFSIVLLSAFIFFIFFSW